jgi:hypothetical protein
MEITTEMIKKLLDGLVLPMFDGIEEIEVEDVYLFDDSDIMYPTINIIFNRDKFFKSENTDLFESEIIRAVKSTLKYLNITESIVDVYVTSE